MATRGDVPPKPVWRWEGVKGWRCIEHGRIPLGCETCRSIVRPPTMKKGPPKGTLYPSEFFDSTLAPYSGKASNRAKLSTVGDRSSGVLSCPRCGGMQFTAKRSIKGKIVAGVLAPKTQVKCIACGLMFKRG